MIGPVLTCSTLELIHLEDNIKGGMDLGIGAIFGIW